ncbi:MAG: toll/interleukin-1 receptor domain-containing protein [Chloroflexi bacterium]|nr:MAG: toll/interleukin-1 receptor domain-containing protein [Chloroflexota bacterium]
MPAEINEPVKVFYSYARKDKDFRDELDKHLSPIKLQYHITSWSDRKIRPGTEWEQEIGTPLETARLICLLISADFMHSDSCRDEMDRALVRHRAGYARVIPIIVRPVYWKGAPFSMLQVLPTDAKPISQWSDPDDAYVNIAKYICEEVEELIRLLKSQENPETFDSHEKHTPIPPHKPTEPLTTNQSIDTSIWVGITRRVRELSLSKGTLLAVLALLLITSMAGGSYVWAVNTSHPVATVTAVTHNEATPTINNGIGVTLVEGEYIGISDGQDALDVAGRVPGVVTLMQEASKSLRNGNTDGAQKKWQEAHEKDTRYAEPLIYAENQRVKEIKEMALAATFFRELILPKGNVMRTHNNHFLAVKCSVYLLPNQGVVQSGVKILPNRLYELQHLTELLWEFKVGQLLRQRWRL